jgi:zinc transport system substrate-binding protein
MKKYAFLLIINLGFCLAIPRFGEGAQNAKISIVTSVFPLLEFAAAVAGERGEVNLLLPPGAGVHTWQPRASDIARLLSADLFIYIGAGLEPWIPELLRSSSSKKLKILAVADFLPLEEKNEPGKGFVDPHVWLDFELDRMILDRIAETVSGIDPSHASSYRLGAAQYNQKLQELDERFSTSLGHCRQKTILLGGHAAFGYLARRFNLQQLSLYGLSPDAEPSPSRLMETIRWAREHNVKAVYMEANSSPKMARVLAKEVQAELLILNTGENLNRKEWASGLTFFDIMEENLKSLEKGLLCD